MQSVLEDAVECFQKQFGTPRFRDYRIAREAEQWFFTDDYQWPFSFVNICSVLGIDSRVYPARSQQAESRATGRNSTPRVASTHKPPATAASSRVKILSFIHFHAQRGSPRWTASFLW